MLMHVCKVHFKMIAQCLAWRDRCLTWESSEHNCFYVFCCPSYIIVTRKCMYGNVMCSLQPNSDLFNGPTKFHLPVSRPYKLIFMVYWEKWNKQLSEWWEINLKRYALFGNNANYMQFVHGKVHSSTFACVLSYNTGHWCRHYIKKESVRIKECP